MVSPELLLYIFSFVIYASLDFEKCSRSFEDSFFTAPQAFIVDAKGKEVFKQETCSVDKWARDLFKYISKVVQKKEDDNAIVLRLLLLSDSILQGPLFDSATLK